MVDIQYTSANQVYRVRDTGVSSSWRSYSHDARGNVTADGIHTFTNDYANQPTAIGGADSGTYQYDGNLKRVKQIVGGETIYSVYDSSGALLTRDNASAGEKTDYLSVAGQTFVRLKNGVATYPMSDHLGTAFQVANQNGSVVAEYIYTPFGEAYGSQSPGLTNEQGFTGHVEDETGLTYMQARYYDPIIGRFLQTDPIGYQDDLNLYAYVHNDPANVTDPNGECPWCVGAIIGATLQTIREVRNGSFKDGFFTKESAKVLARIGGATAIGAVTGGVGGAISKSVVGLGVRGAAKTIAVNAAKNAAVGSAASTAGKVAVNTAEAAIDGGVSGAGAAIADGSVLEGASTAAVNGAVFGAAGSVVGDVVTAGVAASPVGGNPGTISPGFTAGAVTAGNTVGNLSGGDLSQKQEPYPCAQGADCN